MVPLRRSSLLSEQATWDLRICQGAAIYKQSHFISVLYHPILSHFLPELAYTTGRNAHFMRFYRDQTPFTPDPANPHETSVYEKLRKYSIILYYLNIIVSLPGVCKLRHDGIPLSIVLWKWSLPCILPKVYASPITATKIKRKPDSVERGCQPVLPALLISLLYLGIAHENCLGLWII